jgi:hypothetical protein
MRKKISVALIQNSISELDDFIVSMSIGLLFMTYKPLGCLLHQ